MEKMKGKMLVLAAILGACCVGYSYGRATVWEVSAGNQRFGSIQREAINEMKVVNVKSDRNAEDLDEESQESDKGEEAQAGDIWKVESRKDKREFYAEDGAELLFYDCEVFTLSNAKDREAAIRVMDALKREEETPEPYLEFANEDYDNMRNSEVQENFRRHSYEKEYTFTEVNGYLSVVCQDVSASGGSHPNVSRHAYVFAPDGTRLYLNDLFKNVDETRETVIAKLRPEMWELCKEDGQESAGLNEVLQQIAAQLEEMGRYERIFSDFFTDGEYGKEEQCWYLDEEGVVLLANPYTLGGYSSQVWEYHVSGKMIDNWKCPVYE